SGTPDSDASQQTNDPANPPGTYTIPVTATDPQGATFTTIVTYVVTNPPPVILADIPDRKSIDGAPFTADIKGFFDDPDDDVLSYDAQGLPPGLTIDPVTGIISGAIAGDASTGGPNGDGIYIVTVTADDGQGGTVSQEFEFEVDPIPNTTVPQPPILPPPGGEPENVDGDPVGLTVTDAVDGISSLGPHMGLPEDLVVTAAVNGIADLGNDISLDGDHPVTEAIEQQRREDAISSTFGSGIGGDFPEYPYLGGQVEAYDGRVLVRSLIYQDEVFVELRNLRSDGVQDWGVGLSSGRPVPDWVTMPAGDLILIDRPADVDHLHLEVLGRLADGSVVTINVRVDLRTGEIVREGSTEVSQASSRAVGTDVASVEVGLSASLDRLAHAERADVTSLFKV
ncbi:MAG: Ig domain-containing protein, partial [Pseudomonadota bacterium]